MLVVDNCLYDLPCAEKMLRALCNSRQILFVIDNLKISILHFRHGLMHFYTNFFFVFRVFLSGSYTHFHKNV